MPTRSLLRVRKEEEMRMRNNLYRPKTPKFKKTFKGSDETFKAMWDAQEWLHEHGFSYGSTDGSPYCPIQKGEYTLPQKLYNFDAEDKTQLAGVMRSSDYRNGNVEIWLYEEFEEVSLNSDESN